MTLNLDVLINRMVDDYERSDEELIAELFAVVYTLAARDRCTPRTITDRAFIEMPDDEHWPTGYGYLWKQMTGRARQIIEEMTGSGL